MDDLDSRVDRWLKRLHLIQALAVRDFKTRYRGSAFGLLWAVIQPLSMMMILYFVFQYGLKAGPQQGVSFISWFFAGVVAWNFFQDAIISSTSVYQDYSYLLKKVNFPIMILPLVKILSSLMIHGAFVLVVALIIFYNGERPSWSLLILPYYALCMVVLLIGLCWIGSALNVFFRDIGQVVQIICQLGFWGTPIIWSVDNLPERFRYLVDFNPIYYVIEGYRNALVYHQFVPDLGKTLYFWLVTLALITAGTLMFRRLRPYFADVL